MLQPGSPGLHIRSLVSCGNQGALGIELGVQNRLVPYYREGGYKGYFTAAGPVLCIRT